MRLRIRLRRDETIHYSDRAALHRALASSDWSVTGERVLCPDCEASIACALVGHRWEEWEPFDAPGYSGRVRYCAFCGHPEYDPPVVHQTGADTGQNQA